MHLERPQSHPNLLKQFWRFPFPPFAQFLAKLPILFLPSLVISHFHSWLNSVPPQLTLFPWPSHSGKPSDNFIAKVEKDVSGQAILLFWTFDLTKCPIKLYDDSHFKRGMALRWDITGHMLFNDEECPPRCRCLCRSRLNGCENSVKNSAQKDTKYSRSFSFWRLEKYTF